MIKRLADLKGLAGLFLFGIKKPVEYIIISRG
jgi:hypothetical protein